VTVRLARQDVQAFGLPQALKSGMTLDAQVHQERRAIWEWVLEPVLTIGRERIKPVG
jgi:membrane fusion protein